MKHDMPTLDGKWKEAEKIRLLNMVHARLLNCLALSGALCCIAPIPPSEISLEWMALVSHTAANLAAAPMECS